MPESSDDSAEIGTNTFHSDTATSASLENYNDVVATTELRDSNSYHLHPPSQQPSSRRQFISDMPPAVYQSVDNNNSVGESQHNSDMKSVASRDPSHYNIAMSVDDRSGGSRSRLNANSSIHSNLAHSHSPKPPAVPSSHTSPPNDIPLTVLSSQVSPRSEKKQRGSSGVRVQHLGSVDRKSESANNDSGYTENFSSDAEDVRHSRMSRYCNFEYFIAVVIPVVKPCFQRRS